MRAACAPVTPRTRRIRPYFFSRLLTRRQANQGSPKAKMPAKQKRTRSLNSGFMAWSDPAHLRVPIKVYLVVPA